MEELKQTAIEHGTSIELINHFPCEVDAGRDILFHIRVLSIGRSDLLGCTIKITDPQNVVVAETELSLFDGESNETNEFLVRAPIIPGEYTWKVLFPAQQKDGIPYEESSVQISFVVKPHVIALSIWGVPSPVSQGEKFKVNIGVKCSAGCSLAGLPIVIEDDNRQQVAFGRLGEVVLPHTNGTYWTEQELNAPGDETLHKWVVHCDTQALEIQHQINSETFLFRTAKAPEYNITIEVSNKSVNMPLEDAYVMLGLYKATTDEHGIAKLKVPGGKQELYVTKSDYLSFQIALEITQEANIKAELEYSPIL